VSTRFEGVVELVVSLMYGDVLRVEVVPSGAFAPGAEVAFTTLGVSVPPGVLDPLEL
jgi:hypothetical protein